MRRAIGFGVRAIVASLAPFLAFGVTAPEWPSVPLPGEVRAFSVGQDITHNGMPMRLQGFVSDIPPDRMVALFRQSMGGPLVESRLGTRHVLGRMQGEFYVSVQVEAAGGGSRGSTAVTHLKAAHEGQDGALRQREQWASRLPAGSRVLSETLSRDGGRSSRHVVFMNAMDEASNRERLAGLLRDEGLALEQPSAPGKALFFKGRAREAIATIHQDGGGNTTVVLNIVTQAAETR